MDVDRIFAELQQVREEVQGLRIEITRSLSILETILGLHNGGYRLDRRVEELTMRVEELERENVLKRLKACESEIAGLRGEVSGWWRLLPILISLVSLAVAIWRTAWR